MSARKLPFVVQPRVKATKEIIGTEESGQIKVERRGYITVGEKAITQESMRGSNAIGDLYELVNAIAEETGKEPKAVLADVSGSEKHEYLSVWSSAISSRVEAIGFEGARRDMVHATAILISRVDPEWTIEDTMELHGDLVKALSAFYTREDNGAQNVLEPTSENTGAEGKE